MVENNKNEEKTICLDENIKEFEVEDEFNQNKTDGVIQNEKLETKGLKLKKSTKDRLNQLQSKFGDAETLISTLLNQYEAIKIENNSKFADRKAEIDKFNYLLDSIRSSYLSSLDMATFIQEKYNEKFQSEIKSRENIIKSLQEENIKIKDDFRNIEEELSIKNNELKDSKDNFTKVNDLINTFENDSKEKSLQIQNLQKHINSLTDIVDQSKEVREKYESLQELVENLQSQISNYKILDNEVLKLNKELEGARSEIDTLKDDLRREREYSNSLNEKMHNLILMNSNESSRLKDQYLEEKKTIETEKNNIIEDNLKVITTLKDEIYNLKLEILKVKK
ncbi:hypothetical protein H8S10_15390 [Clostridium sp. NSJ-49]|uniref:hypothetical protein n=1 Tax=unclassified Clostridium TaxID=2614128 RepID=UPI00164ADA27|nr:MULTISPECIES: hypothetical protein [unclassified Clostridium]MBC5626825.1 hypothetical protein [Clostridium sp. NSJ-49]MCD2500963.1 hypothetical protein [Clostridium sp. NSJ-145]MDU6339698.1 hypothetical protein [Clostridium sp.]